MIKELCNVKKCKNKVLKSNHPKYASGILCLKHKIEYIRYKNIELYCIHPDCTEKTINNENIYSEKYCEKHAKEALTRQALRMIQ